MRRLLIICFVLSLYGLAPAQSGLYPFRPDTTNPFPRFVDRLYYGGSVGLWVGNPTYVNLTPIIGIKLSKKFSVGGSFTYNYYQQNYQGYKYTNYIYGGGPFARYKVLENLFVQAEWDRLSVLDPNLIIENSRVWVDNILIGAGYRQPFNDYGSFVIMAFWNLNDTPLSPYPNPIIQAGFNLKF